MRRAACRNRLGSSTFYEEDMDQTPQILEEIALDGLDGITLDSLWYRLGRTFPQFRIKLDDKSKSYLWTKVVSKFKDVKFYVLPEERDTFVDPEPQFSDTGVEIYKPDPLRIMMPCCYIIDGIVRGSCSTFSTRKDVTTEVRGRTRQPKLSYTEVQSKWGKRFVIVASQRVRERVLLKDSVDASTVKLTAEMYCLLEYLAKGRNYGVYGSDVFTFLQGLASSRINHGMMGYLRKKLKSYGVVTQVSHVLMKPSHNNSLRLFHDNICFLPRLFMPRETIYTIYHRKIEEFLLGQTDRKYFLADMCSTLELPRRKVHKFLKLKPQHFELSYITVKDSTFLSCPDTNETENGQNDRATEGTAADNDNSVDTSTLEETDKDMDTSSTPLDNKGKAPVGKKGKLSARSHLQVTLKQTIKEAEDADDVVSDGEDGDQSSDVVVPWLHRLDEPMFVQMMEWIECQGPHGVTKHMIRKTFGLHSLQVRNIIKYFYKNKCLHFFYREKKRQRVEWLCAKKYASVHENEEVTEPVAKLSMFSPSASTSNQSEGISEVSANTLQSSGAKAKPDSTGSARRNILTNKMAERRRTVVNLALEHRLILFADLTKLIIATEADKYDTKMDRKTLKRICEHLNKTKDIKIYKTTVQVESKTRDLFYVCEPTMTLDNNLMKSSLESQRSELMSSIASVKVPANEKKAEPNDVDVKAEPVIPYTANPNSRLNKYGLAPKMKRAEVLHQFLCYTIYNYEGCPDGEEEMEEFTLSDNEVIKVPVYSKTDDWKRFIPPNILTTEENSDGVACLLDLGTQLPLERFLMLVRFPYDVPEITELFEHKIKRLIPVRCLPMKLQSLLLYKRKYINALRETTSLLCMMGLVTNISKAEGSVTYRDISVIYLHKLATYIDTTRGLITADNTEEEITAKRHVWKVNKGMCDVDNFWLSLQNTCISTIVKRFGKDKAKNLEEPDTTRHDIYKAERLKDSHSPKVLNEVQEGVIPGDGRGAAGLDTLFFAHLCRQWSAMFVPNPQKPPANTAASSQEDPQKQPSYSSQVKVTPTVVQVDYNTATRAISNTKPFKNKRANADQRHLAKRMKLDRTSHKKADKAKERKSKALQRRRQRNDARRNAKDEKDYMAEEKLETQRSIFTPQEDEALMLAKIGLNILGCKEVATKHVRDFLHKSLPKVSKDKSSRSCWARIMSSQEIAKYQDTAPTLTPSFSETYSKLMELIIRKCENAVKSEVTIDLSTVNGLEDLNSQYHLIVIAETQEMVKENMGHSHGHKIAPPIEVSWKEPTSDVDVVKFTLNNFIMSYLFVNDKMKRTFQMHKVFEQYPSKMADSALHMLQSNKVATQRKTQKNPTIRRFGLSYKYQLFAERIQVVAREVFDSCSKAITELEISGSSYHQYTDVDDWRGKLLMFLTLVPSHAIDIKFDLPEKVLDMSSVAQSDDEEDEEDDDLAENSKTVSAKDKLCRMKYEHCQIKPCTVQACLRPDNLPDVLKATRLEDKKYVRTLMSSVMYDFESVREFDDLLDAVDGPDKLILQALYDIIDKSGLLGISLHSLYESLCGVHKCTMSSLLSCLRCLTDSQLVLSVGITERVYITHGNSRTWVVHSLRDTKGRGSGVALDEKDKVTLSEEVPQEEEAHSISNENPEKPISSTYHRVDIIPKPWLTPEGTINYESLYQILSSVVSTINKYQSINFKSLHRLFSMVYAPTLLLDLLQILQDLGCVSCHYLTPPVTQKPSLFSKKPTYELSDEPLRPDSIAHYIVKHEAMQRISLFIRNTSQKHSSVKLKT
ncbi:general transcription factor 3C polypeptide 1-like [Watersipora subatra]|uniref:general transcription factor 3C polypeptide 1-like n=1 Tax=Watersipora subatra TaxID=2589382 RepID=UPI00355BE0A7